ncbi:formate dehydrogenase accessory protein FdhE [uncultured Paracoccus sp.]|uniref:formate dehydrogenase accessory protein FdhE n=1 Tax=uncultured Paracoccus sp. TaxID=189685 RepID=UPI0026268F45|nr:formate dehydrogenase accessory protein FdhE [uncultured Paracoccus sp.]
MTQDVQPRPDMIGGVPTPPLAILPQPERLFAARADRFAFLAETSKLGPYLRFLAELSRVQDRMCRSLPAPAALPADRIALARSSRMPPIDRHALIDDPNLTTTLEQFCREADGIDMPAPARLALQALTAATNDDRRWLVGNVLDDAVPADSAAPHLFVAAAIQVHLGRMAAALDAGQLVAIRTGVCPSCGGKPVSSVVIGIQGAEGTRYAVCNCCQTQWNEVRVKCLCCGSTKGIGFRSLDDGSGEATIRAETCEECGCWVKQMLQTRNPSLDPVADDVASMGLDALMQSEPWRRGGLNPFLIGY